MHDNGLTDDYGLVRVSGNNNSIVANHFSEIIDTPYIKPCLLYTSHPALKATPR